MLIEKKNMEMNDEKERKKMQKPINKSNQILLKGGMRIYLPFFDSVFQFPDSVMIAQNMIK